MEYLDTTIESQLVDLEKEDNEKRERIKKYIMNIDPLTDYDNGRDV